jgi:hypothetical protein
MKNYKQLKADIILDFYIDEICKFREVKKTDVLKKSREREFADIRAMASYLAKKQVPKIGLREMANYFGLKNHATALYSVVKIENLKPQDWDIQRTLEHCEKLDFVEQILLNNGFIKLSEYRFSKAIDEKNLVVSILSKGTLISCSHAGNHYFHIGEVDIFDAIIIGKNINSNPLGVLINSLKN